MQATGRKNVHLVCGGKFHDFDYARLELLGLLSGFGQVRTTVAGHYGDLAALEAADVLLTYTSDVIPDDQQLDALEAFLRRGGKWFALHGTNSALCYNRERKCWEAPNVAPRFFAMLGSQFEAHPPIEPYEVRACASHPLVEGVEPFEADDELYLCRFTSDVHCLVETSFGGRTPGFAKDEWPQSDTVPVMYLHRWEDSEVLYLTLGHARGHLDMQPLMNWYEKVERGSWKRPGFRELLHRGMRWALGELPGLAPAGA